MSALLNVISVAGGHALIGRRAPAYAYLLSLVLLPPITWVYQGWWISNSPHRINEASDAAAVFFWVVFTCLWTSSMLLLVRDRFRNRDAAQSLHITEVALVSIASVAAIAFSILSIGIAPFLDSPPTHKRSTYTSVVGKAMPTESGSVELRGVLYIQGSVAPKQSLVFVFDGNRVSKEIVTDADGRFFYTLPPGRWVLLAPHVLGSTEDLQYSILPPIERPELSFDVVGGSVAKTYEMRIDVK